MICSILLTLGLAAAQQAPLAPPAVDPVPAPDPATTPALEAAPAPTPGADGAPAAPCAEDEASRTLLETLLLLLANDTGAVAAEHLGALGDPRAVPPLVHTARTRQDAVALAACRALGRYPEALPALVALASDDALRDAVRVAAVAAIGEQGAAGAADALVRLTREPRMPRAVRAAILDTVRARFPERAGEVEGEVAQRGTGWLIAGGAGGLGFALASVGYYGQADLEGLGGVTGALAGGSLGFVAGRRWPIDGGQAAFLSSAGLVGTVSGLFVGCGIGEETACWNGGLAGEVTGFGLGAALKGRRARTQVETVEALVLSGATGLAAGTAGHWGTVSAHGGGVWDLAERNGQIAAGLGLAGGLAAGQWLAPRVDLTGSDIGQMTLGSTWGGFAGALLYGPESNGESTLTGIGLGALTAYGLATPLELGGDAVFTGYVGLGYGSMVGLGGGLLLGEAIDIPGGEEFLRGTVLATGTAGMGLGAWLAHRNPEGIRANDIVLTSLTTGWAAWQTTGWWNEAGADERLGGLNALVPAAVGASTALASSWTDIRVGDTLSAASLGFWGIYLGAVGGVLADAREPLIPTLVASDVGLGAGVVLMSPLVDAPPIVVGMADAGGVVGATTGAVVAALVTGDQDPILVASLVGAGAGALGGGLAGRAIDKRRAPRPKSHALLFRPRLDLPGTWSLAPAAVSDGSRSVPGAVLSVDGW